MKVNISIADVRKVCETLLEENGDTFETSRKTNVSVDDVRRIKEGRYMKSISETYFDSSRWSDNPSTGVQEPEPVQLVMDDLEEKPVKETKPEPKKETKKETKVETEKSEHGRYVDETTVRKICELICSGMGNLMISKEVNTSTTIISNIRRKLTWKHISDEYFEVIEGTSSDIKVLKTGEILINNRDHRRGLKSSNVKSVKTVKPATEESHDILAEIENLATQYITHNKTIDELPASIKEKVLAVIKEEVRHLSLSDIKELTTNG